MMFSIDCHGDSRLHRPIRWAIASLALSVLTCSPLRADDRNPYSQVGVPPAITRGTGTERKDTGHVIPGAVAEQRAEKVAESVRWLKSLDEAKALAKKQHKPIFWVHLLGDPDGEC